MAGPAPAGREGDTRLAPTRFFRLLETGATLPHGTKDIRVNGALIGYIWRRSGRNPSGRRMHNGDLYEAFYGRPVKAVYAVLAWAEKNAPDDPEEQMRAIRNWSRKQSKGAA